MNRGRCRNALSAAGRAARYSAGLDSSTPAACIMAIFISGSSCVSDMTFRQSAICSWMLILTGHTLAQLPSRRGERQLAVFVRVERRVKNNADRTGIGRPVAETAAAPKHGAGVHARSAANTFQRRPEPLRAQPFRPTVVDQDDVHFTAGARAPEM